MGDHRGLCGVVQCCSGRRDVLARVRATCRRSFPSAWLQGRRTWRTWSRWWRRSHRSTRRRDSACPMQALAFETGRRGCRSRVARVDDGTRRESWLVVTSGRFTAEAERFAADQGLELLDGAALRSLARHAIPPGRGPTATVVLESPVFDEALADAGVLVSSPACPLCARTMIQRTARRGATIGSMFWGCPAFPGCRGTRRA